MRVIGILGLVAIGTGLGWVLASLQVEAPAPADPALPAAAAPRPGPSPLARGEPAPPALRGHADPGAPATSEELRGPVPAVLAELEREDLAEWADWEEDLGAMAGADQRGWQALLTLYALAGRADDFARVVPKALAAEISTGTVLELVALMPAGQQAALADRITTDQAEAPWPTAALARIYIDAGAPARAREVLVPALEAAPDLELVRLLVDADPEGAADLLATLAGHEAVDASFLGGIGGHFVEAGRPDLALAFLHRSLAERPLSKDVLMSLAGIDEDAALAHAERLTDTHGHKADVWAWLARIRMDAGDSAAAFEAYREAAARALSSEVVYGLLRADPARAYEAVHAHLDETRDDEVLGAVAKVALKSDRPTESFDVLLRAHEIDPSDHEWNTALVAFDPERAVDVLAKTVRSYDGGSRDEVVGAYGNALLEAGRSKEAFDRYLEAYELDRSDWEWHRGLARSDPERAVPILEERYESQGDDSSLLGALADAYAGTGQSARALAYYDKAIEHGGGAHWLARMSLVDPVRARSALDERLASNADDAHAWGALGDLHRFQGRDALARAAYARARELAPTTMRYEILWRRMAD